MEKDNLHDRGMIILKTQAHRLSFQFRLESSREELESELINDGYFGLVKAIQNFNPNEIPASRLMQSCLFEER